MTVLAVTVLAAMATLGGTYADRATHGLSIRIAVGAARVFLAPFYLAQSAAIVFLLAAFGQPVSGFPLVLRILLLAVGFAPYVVIDIAIRRWLRRERH